MKTLDEIAIHYQTDRASVFTRTYGKPHAYAPRYDSAFYLLRDKPVKMLEIGAAGGEGIQMWLEYFSNPDSQVFGVDIVHSTNPYNTVGNKPDPRYTFVTADQSSEVFWDCFVATYGSDWDILVDDGGHSSQQIITTFRKMWPHIKRGGFHCIEDLNCSYSGLPFFLPEGWPTHMQFICGLLDKINLENEIESLRFSKELAIIRKA